MHHSMYSNNDRGMCRAYYICVILVLLILVHSGLHEYHLLCSVGGLCWNQFPGRPFSRQLVRHWHLFGRVSFNLQLHLQLPQG